MSVTDSGHWLWVRSSYSTNGNCVEVAARADARIVRDSGITDSPHLAYPKHEWRAFIEHIKVTYSRG